MKKNFRKISVLVVLIMLVSIMNTPAAFAPSGQNGKPLGQDGSPPGLSDNIGWTVDGDDVYKTNPEGNVGIGMIDPNYKLDVDGDIHASGSLLAGSTTTYGDGYIALSEGINLNIASGALYIDCITHRVGIGTTSPGAKLDVEVSSGGAATIGHSSCSATGYCSISMGYKTTASGFASIAMGKNTIANGEYSTVGGGEKNTADSDYATVGGGYNNIAIHGATIGGGFSNTASGLLTTIAGGENNIASNLGATVCGGRENEATGISSIVCGGFNNNASEYAIVGGGHDNNASGYGSFVGCGGWNKASGIYATLGGGRRSTVSGKYGTMGGGANNFVSGYGGTVAGGRWNIASENYTTVGGGWGNTAGGNYTTVLGGGDNKVVGVYSVAAGYNVEITSAANHTFAFGQGFTTSTPNAVIFYDSASPIKVGVQTTNPQRALHIKDVLRLEPRNTPPTSPSAGDIYTDGDHIYCYLDGGWKQLDN
jgi:hypothetical protein